MNPFTRVEIEKGRRIALKTALIRAAIVYGASNEEISKLFQIGKTSVCHHRGAHARELDRWRKGKAIYSWQKKQPRLHGTLDAELIEAELLKARQRALL